MSLKGGTALAYDNVITDIIKLLYDKALEQLVNIIYTIINTGIVPISLKIAIITSIHKKGNPTKLEYYRPVSLLSTFSKIF